MTATLMRFAFCDHCRHRDRVADDQEHLHQMCNGCGHFGSLRLIGVTEPEIADALRVEFPTPTVNANGLPV